MRHDAGLLCDGIRRALQRARNAICRCAASQCFYHAASHCSRASNLSAVQSTLKVSYQIYHFSNCTRLSIDCVHIAPVLISFIWHFFNLFFYQIVMKIFFHSRSLSRVLGSVKLKSISQFFFILHRSEWEKICLINYGILSRTTERSRLVWNWNWIYDYFSIWEIFITIYCNAKRFDTQLLVMVFVGERREGPNFINYF